MRIEAVEVEVAVALVLRRNVGKVIVVKLVVKLRSRMSDVSWIALEISMVILR